MKYSEINAEACTYFSEWRMCNEIQWDMMPVLSAHTNPYFVDIDAIFILLKGFIYQNL